MIQGTNRIDDVAWRFGHSEISIPFQLEAQCNPVTLCAAAAVAAGDEGRRDSLCTKGKPAKEQVTILSENPLKTTIGENEKNQLP